MSKDINKGVLNEVDILSKLQYESYSKTLENLPPLAMGVLSEAGEVAQRLGVNIYVVGGFVRDIILGVENLDIDIVVEGNGLEFAEELIINIGEVLNRLSITGSVKLTKYDRFKTAFLDIGNSLGIDIVTARKEIYEYPGALPQICQGSLMDDIFRRDFTINSMAFVILRNGFGKLVDFYGGKEDLSKGLVRILHPESFIDDPTRLFRAVRFEQRYGFQLEEITLKLAKEAIDSDVLKTISKERISFEFFIMLKEKKLVDMLKRMKDIGLIEKAYPELRLNKDIFDMLLCYKEYFEKLNDVTAFESGIDEELLRLLIIFSNIDIETGEILFDKMKLSKPYREKVQKFLKLVSDREKLKNSTDYIVYKTLLPLCHEGIVVFCLLYKEYESRILQYLKITKNIKLLISGRDLNNIGIKPGPLYREIYDKIIEEKIKGNLNSYEEELHYVKMIYKVKETGL